MVRCEVTLTVFAIRFWQISGKTSSVFKFRRRYRVRLMVVVPGKVVILGIQITPLLTSRLQS